MHPYSSIDMTAAWKKLCFILSVRFDFHMIKSLSIAVHAFISRVSMSFSVDETLLPWEVNLSTSLREVPSSCYALTCWPGQKCHSRWCTGRKWHILVAIMRGNRVGRNWLMKWDEVKKTHYTLIDWRTGREWPLNCMTVISAWWRSHRPFQR